jgi:hypothetical protein
MNDLLHDYYDASGDTILAGEDTFRYVDLLLIRIYMILELV